MTEEAHEIARILAAWLDKGGDGLRRIYLYGSTVRGDSNPRDIDVRIFEERDLDYADNDTIRWWIHQKEDTEFSDLRARLPRPLHIVMYDNADVDRLILAGARDPVHVEGRVVCVWTPPAEKTGLSQAVP